MLGWILAVWAVALCLNVLVLFQALRWLRTGDSAKGWTLRKLRSRGDAYRAVAFAGWGFGIFIQSPVGPWMSLLRALHLNRQLEFFFLPMVVLPALLVLIARSVDVARRVRADLTRA